MGTRDVLLSAFYRALGPTEALSPELQRALEPWPDFEPAEAPGPHGWLAIHGEPGQSFDQFRAVARLPDALRHRIYLQPLDDLPPGSSWDLGQVQAFAQVFYGLETCVMPPLHLRDRAPAGRHAPDSGGPQVDGGAILSSLASGKPADAFCLVALTGQDIYPNALVTYAFGIAQPALRVALCSVARYGPPFCRPVPGHTAEARRRRCCEVVVHEIGHLVGLEHCVLFRCLMNGSSDLEESDRRPPRLCPIDLRKLQWALGFDVVDRYRQLRRFWADAGVDQEVRWLDRRLAAITGHP